MIGRFNTQVVLSKPILGISYGETNETWATLATVWAEVLPRGSRETYRLNQVEGQWSYVVYCRARTDVTSDCRITIGTRVLKLIGPPTQTMRDGTQVLEMICTEVED